MFLNQRRFAEGAVGGSAKNVSVCSNAQVIGIVSCFQHQSFVGGWGGTGKKAERGVARSQFFQEGSYYVPVTATSEIS